MSDRFENFLLNRLRREAARDAIDVALSRGWLADEDERETEADEGSSGRRGHFFGDDDDDDPRRSSVRMLKLGPKLEGLSGDEVARLLVRDSVDLDPQSSRAGQQVIDESASPRGFSSSLLGQLLRAIRTAAAPPPVEEIAVALLLAQGLARSCVSEEEVLLVLRSPRPIVSLVCPVPGFERLFVKMLRAGLIVPSAIATGIGQDVRGQHLPFTGNTDNARKVIVFAGRRFESDDGAERADLQLGIAATLGYPLIAVAEKPERIPTPLRVAASLDLDCGHLTAELIGKVMTEALGPLPSGLPIDDLDADCALLTLADLSLAIREGVSHERAIEILERLGHARRIAAEEYDEEDSGKSGSGSSSSGWRSSRDKTVKGSGSEIIKPVRPETIACDAFVPTVERLHGYGEARTWALDLKQDLELWREKKLDWSALSAKLLLSGPPGTGKTSFAKALCNSLQVPLIATSVSTWLEASYLGDVVRRMRVAFEEASSHAPCILFIDEIDGIGQRGQGKAYDDYWNTVVNKALELLDGAVRSSGIIIVGATNHPDVIDPALLRSGRLETHIHIPPPDIDALAGILRHHLGNDVARVIETRPKASAAVAPAPVAPSARRDAPDADLSKPSQSETDETGGPRARSPRGA